MEALDAFLISLSGQTFDEEEGERIKMVLNDIEFEKITSNEGNNETDKVFEEYNEEDNKSSYEFDVEDWENDNFFVNLSKQDVDRLVKTPILSYAINLATGRADSRYRIRIEEAVKCIEKYASCHERQAAMLKRLGLE